MKNVIKISFLILLYAICPSGILGIPFGHYSLNAAYAAVPHLINYQGKLTDKSGLPLEGAYNITFRIYDAETAGNLLWEETHSGVVVQKGVFSLMLGAVSALDLEFSQACWLAIKVGSDAEMSPRQRLGSVAYAVRAENADNADTLEDKQASEFIWRDETAGGDLSGTYPDPEIADAVVSQPKLKTAIGTVSATFVVNGGFSSLGCFVGMSGYATGKLGEWISGTVFMPTVAGGSVESDWQTRITLAYGGTTESGQSAVSDQSMTLPGGEYGFYPQTKHDGGSIIYVRQRYVTASGLDPWLFLVYDTDANMILSTWYAPDHPSYGQGPDETEMPHPFSEYIDADDPQSDAKIPDNIEIVLVELEQTRQLQEAQYETTTRTVTKDEEELTIEDKKLTRTVSEIVSQDYVVDESAVYVYAPRDISDSQGNHWDIETIPDYIKVRRLREK